MNESDLWEWLRDVALPIGQYSRIETGDTSPGFPDVYCQLGPENSCTLELKCARDPNRKTPFTERRGMRRSQIKWIRENVTYGGRVWIIAEVFPEVYVISGRKVDLINGASKDYLRVISRAILHRRKNEEAAEKLRKVLMEKWND